MTFLETIKIRDGVVCNREAHLRRTQETANVFFKRVPEVGPEELSPPAELSGGIVKCRILYDWAVRQIEFIPYTRRVIRTLRLVEDDTIDYSYKFAERMSLNTLWSARGSCDDILIVRKGMLTDTGFSNIVLSRHGKFYTPDTFLLNGTKRQLLLRENKIRECRIPAGDLSFYERVYLINALLCWKTGDFTLNFGLIGLEQFNIQEKFWGYRYILKSFQDKYKFGSSADMGVVGKYKFASWFSADLTFINREGYKKLNKDNKYRYGIGLTFYPVQNLTVRGYSIAPVKISKARIRKISRIWLFSPDIRPGVFLWEPNIMPCIIPNSRKMRINPVSRFILPLSLPRNSMSSADTNI